MIQAIELQNFKCVQAAQRIDIRPLTLLFGPNSSGKSTVLDAVSVLCSAVLRANGLRSVFEGTEQGADVLQTVRNSQATASSPSVVRVAVDPVVGYQGWVNHAAPDAMCGAILRECCKASAAIEVGVRWGCDLWSFSPVVLELRINARTALVTALPSVVNRIAGYPIILDVHHPALADHIPAAWRRHYDTDSFNLTDAARGAFSAPAQLVYVLVDSGRQRASLIRQRLNCDDAPIVGGFGDERGWWSWQTQVAGLASRMLSEDRSVTNWRLWTQLSTDVPLWIAQACSSPDHSAYVGAHRQLSDAVVRQASDGSLVAEDDNEPPAASFWLSTLVGSPAVGATPSDSPHLSHGCLSVDGHRVSKWCSDTKRLDLGIELEVVPSFEVTASESLRRCIRDARPADVFEMLALLSELGLPSFRLRVRTRDGGSRDLSEVGEGIGCVLPVVVSALTVPGVVYIEQPEIHLHPRIEARLGDLFAYGLAHISASQSVLDGMSGLPSAPRASPCRIIETHSEHLVLRLLRRLRESASGTIAPEVAEWCDEIAAVASLEDAAPSVDRPRPLWLRTEDLAVVCAETTPHGTVYRPMKVTKDGELVGRWPGGFFEERWEEL